MEMLIEQYFIDNNGKVVSGSMMTTLIADYLSEKKNNFKSCI
jgi:hypothetical protein